MFFLLIPCSRLFLKMIHLKKEIKNRYKKIEYGNQIDL